MTLDIRSLTLLDGLGPSPISAAVRDQLTESGLSGPAHALAEARVVPCQGCFQCWTKHPGACKAQDDANRLMRDVIGSDAVLWTTRLRFGSWSSTVKAALDRSIGLLSPFFCTIEGETHHHRRYPRYPRHGAIAVIGPEVTAKEREVFATLVKRNVLNLRGDVAWVGFVPEHPRPALLRSVVQEGLQRLAEDAPSELPRVAPVSPLASAEGVALTPGRPRHAVLWVGSAKPRGRSTSEALGRDLMGRLEARGWTCEIVYAARALRLGRASSPGLVDAARRADLLILSAPVYFDGLPALVIRGLESLDAADLGPRRPALLPIVQCGFPELAHTALALEIAALAADRLGLPWAGHLAMGGGGMIDGQRPGRSPGRFRHQIHALDRAADALDAGRPVPPEATATFATLPIPAAMYRTIGQAGWATAALKNRAFIRLWRRPFESS